MTEISCQHATAHGIHDAFGGYELHCVNCGAIVPDPFFLTPVERLCLTENSLSRIGLGNSGAPTVEEWWNAIDGDDDWLDEQIRRL